MPQALKFVGMRIIGVLLFVLGAGLLVSLWAPGAGLALTGSPDVVLIFKLLMSGFGVLIAIGGILAFGIGLIRADLRRH